MQDFDDQLDLLDDDGDGIVEISLLEEEEKSDKGGRNNKSGCFAILFVLGSSLVMAGWCFSQFI